MNNRPLFIKIVHDKFMIHPRRTCSPTNTQWYLCSTWFGF